MFVLENNSPEQTGKINHPINNATKLYKTDISTCIDPMEDLNQTTTVVTLKEKGKIFLYRYIFTKLYNLNKNN